MTAADSVIGLVHHFTTRCHNRLLLQLATYKKSFMFVKCCWINCSCAVTFGNVEKELFAIMIGGQVELLENDFYPVSHISCDAKAQILEG